MPRKHLVVLAAALAALAAPATTVAAYSLLDFQSAADSLAAVDPTIDPPPNDPSLNFAVGGFKGADDNNVGFSAHSGAVGQDAQGHLSETIPLFYGTPPRTYQGRFTITCLAVAGKVASMGLVPTDAASNDQPAEFVFVVRDTGLAGGMGDSEVFIPDVPAQDCAVGLPFASFGFPIVNGDILVNDAIP
jgi:hypothetical protein